MNMRKLFVIMTMVLAAAVALPAMAVEFREQKTDFRTQTSDFRSQSPTPAASFRSTSVMTTSGSMYSANPSLNADGTAVYKCASYSPAQAPSGPRRVIGNPDGDDEDDTENGSPLGDALLPLMLLACAYLIIRMARRRRDEGMNG